MSEQRERIASGEEVRQSVALQVFVVLGSPLAWVAQLVLSYFVIAVGCNLWSAVVVQVLLYLVSIGALVVAAAAGVLALRAMRGDERGAGTLLEGPDERSQFASVIGTWTSFLFLAVILVSAIAVVLMSPCS